MKILNERPDGAVLVPKVVNNCLDGFAPDEGAGAEPSLPGDELIAPLGLSDGDGLNQPVFADALGELSKLALAELLSGLERAWTNQLYRKLEYGVLFFKRIKKSHIIASGFILPQFTINFQSFLSQLSPLFFLFRRRCENNFYFPAEKE